MEEASAVCSEISELKRILFAAKKLPQETPGFWDIVSSFGYKNAASRPSIEKIRVLVENIEVLDKEALQSEDELLKELLHHEGFLENPLGIVLISSNSTCKTCGCDLLVRADRPSFLTGYTNSLGTVPVTHFRKYCKKAKQGCSFTQHYGFHCFGEETEFDNNWADLPFFMSSHKTVFEMEMLRDFNAELLIGQVSYNQRCDIYNYVHGYDDKRKVKAKRNNKAGESEHQCHRFEDRLKLDRRRFEEGHLKFCILDVYKKYPNAFPKWVFKNTTQMTLDEVAPTYYSAFSEKYAAHKCTFPGCGKVTVLDGNLKNRRDVCASSEAGFIQYSSIEGTIKTGCQLSPCTTSKFCYYHAPRFSKGTESDNIPEVQIITAMRETRSGKHYKVVTISEDETVMWMPSSQVPAGLIDEYEKSFGVMSDESYRVISHTIVAPNLLDDKPTSSPPTKKRKKECWVDGAFGDHPSDTIKCNTEKDKGSSRLHDRTSGILAAMFPCGMIVALSELFRAESKSQVYGVIHEFLTNHSNVASNLQYICYDDGCHLRKYARNGSRKDLTPTAKLLAKIEIVVDKLHMKGHTDQWCRETCDPNLFSELNDVDTEVCEQCFSWLSRYARITRRMNRNNFIFFVLYLCDLHNIREEEILKRSGYM